MLHHGTPTCTASIHRFPRQDTVRSPHVETSKIIFWQVSVNTTHEIDNSVAKEDSINGTIQVSESLMNLGCDLDWVNKITLVSENSFGRISCRNSAKALNLCWKLSVISAEKRDFPRLRILE